MRLLLLLYLLGKGNAFSSRDNSHQSFSLQNAEALHNRLLDTSLVDTFRPVLPRSAAPPRSSPATPPESRRQSIDMSTTSSPNESPKKIKNKQEKQHSGSATGGTNPSNARKAHDSGSRLQRNRPPRSPSPQSSSGSDHGFVRTSEMYTARVYGPPSSSDEEEERKEREARRRRLSQRRQPYSLRKGQSVSLRRHYSSDSEPESNKDGSNSRPHSSATGGASSDRNPPQQ